MIRNQQHESTQNPTTLPLEITISVKVEVTMAEYDQIRNRLAQEQVENNKEQHSTIHLNPQILNKIPNNISTPIKQSLFKLVEKKEEEPKKMNSSVLKVLEGNHLGEGNRKKREISLEVNSSKKERGFEKVKMDKRKNEEINNNNGFRRIEKKTEQDFTPDTKDKTSPSCFDRKVFVHNNFNFNEESFKKRYGKFLGKFEKINENFNLPNFNFDSNTNKREETENNELDINNMPLFFTPKKEPTPLYPQNNWEFENLNKFFSSYYLDKFFDPSLVENLNFKERIVFTRMLDVPLQKRDRLIRSNYQLLSLARRTFLTSKDDKKAYKITNSKRFVFRKIKTIMYQEFKRGEFRRHLSKKDLDRQFFNRYFSSQPEFRELCDIEKSIVETLYFTYKESKIEMVWKFREFTRDFLIVLRRFPEELMKGYFKPKYESIKIFLESLKGKDVGHLERVKPPCKKLPINHCTVELYISDFIEAFGKYLNK